jgi:hypothetical protein
VSFAGLTMRGDLDMSATAFGFALGTMMRAIHSRASTFSMIRLLGTVGSTCSRSSIRR